MNNSLETKPNDIKGITTYLNQFNASKLFMCAFENDSFLHGVADSMNCPIDNITENFKQMPVDISEFFNGFILTSDVFILVSKTKAIGNISSSASYTEFLTLVDRIKQKKLKHLSN